MDGWECDCLRDQVYEAAVFETCTEQLPYAAAQEAQAQGVVAEDHQAVVRQAAVEALPGYRGERIGDRLLLLDDGDAIPNDRGGDHCDAGEGECAIRHCRVLGFQSPDPCSDMAGAGVARGLDAEYPGLSHAGVPREREIPDSGGWRRECR